MRGVLIMPRKLRNIAQGMTHHCFSRCHAKKPCLATSYGKRYFVEAIKKCQNKYNFELVAAEPVGDHIHLIIRTIDEYESISKIMQYIKSRIAEMYNKATGSTGAFWNERYGSTVIEVSDNPEQYLLWLLWYIGYNPVRKGLSRDPRKNYISFIKVYLDENFQAEIKITRHRFFLQLGSSFQECVEKFLKYEIAYMKRIAVYF